MADDILRYDTGFTDDEATKDTDITLGMLLQRCREQNVRLNKGKNELKKFEITFLGHAISKVDPQKVSVILQMKAPNNVTGVQLVCRTTNKFISTLPVINVIY